MQVAAGRATLALKPVGHCAAREKPCSTAMKSNKCAGFRGSLRVFTYNQRLCETPSLYGRYFK